MHVSMKLGKYYIRVFVFYQGCYEDKKVLHQLYLMLKLSNSFVLEIQILQLTSAKNFIM